jgi:hypothetical protein
MNTNKLVIISFAMGLGAAAGCGTDPVSSASGVFPAEGFAGRSLRVEISGDQTSWKTGATVDMGAGVTVNSVEVASPTDLFADVTIDPAAALGLNDVTVTSGGKLTLKAAFQIVSPVEVQIQGTAAQGGLGVFKIVNKDFDNPFDTTQGTDPNTGATVFPNVRIDAPNGVDFNSPLTSGLTVAPYEIDGLVLFDVDAAGGAVTVTSGPTGKQVTSTVGDFAVTTRAAMAAGPSVTGNIAAAYDSQLYTLASGTAPSLDRFAVTTASQTGQPGVALLGPSGHWSDFVGGGPYAVVSDAGAAYAIVYDLSGAMNYSFTLTSTVETLTVGSEGDDATNATIGGAGVTTASASPFIQTGGAVSANNDLDIVKIVVPAGSPMIGKVFHVTTSLSQDPFTALSVDVTTGSGGNTSIAGGPQTADALNCFFAGICGVDFTTAAATPIVAGTYYFKIAADAANWASSDTEYDLLFWTE